MSAPRQIDLPFHVMAQACQIAAVDLHGIDETTIETVRFELMQDGASIFGRVHVTYKVVEPLDITPTNMDLS